MLESEGHRTVVASSAEEGLRMARDNQFSVLFLDVRLPGVSGIEALPRFREYSNAPVIIITAFGDLETAVTAVQQGASEYATKPFKLDAVLNTFRRTLAKHEYQTDNSPQPAELKPTLMVGQSPAMQDVFRQIAMVAQSELSVLVTGETGTGKELV
ncbi:MAG: response regulator, partial [Planctomycetota bacterium]